MTHPASLGDIQLKLHGCMDGRRKEQTMRTLFWMGESPSVRGLMRKRRQAFFNRPPAKLDEQLREAHADENA